MNQDKAIADPTRHERSASRLSQRSKREKYVSWIRARLILEILGWLKSELIKNDRASVGTDVGI